MIIQFFPREERFRPVQKTSGSAGFDLVAAQGGRLNPGERACVPSGCTLWLAHGYEGQVRPRSGLALKYGVTVLNAPATIDCDYRDEIGIILINHGTFPFTWLDGDRIAQLVVTPCLLMLTGGVRAGGFGSTGI